MTAHTLFVILNYCSVFVMIACCVVICTHETSKMQERALLVSLSLLVCCIGFLFRVEATSADALILGQKLVYTFVTPGMYFMLLFILDYCEFSIPTVIKGIFHALNLLLSLFVLTLDHHNLFYKSYWAIDMGGYAVLEKDYGPLHTVAIGLFALYMAATVVIAVWFSIKNTRDRRAEPKRIWKLLVAVTIPCLAYIIPKLTDMNNDLQPMAFAAFSVLVITMIYKNKLYDPDNIAAEYSIKSINEGVIVFDAQYRFKGCNEKAKTFFPLLKGMPINTDVSKTFPLLREYLDGLVSEYRQGDDIYEITIRPIQDGDRVVGQVIWMENVTIRRRYTDLLEERQKNLESAVDTLYDLGFKDDLTGLCNRRCFENALTDLRKTGKSNQITLCAIDLNGLKAVNDKVGHPAGDELIRGVADIIGTIFTSRGGSAYRTGGDEFFGLLPDAAPSLEELSEALDRDMGAWHGKSVGHLSFSYGFARGIDHPDSTVDELLLLADRAMYDKKKDYYSVSGRNRRQR